MGTRLHAKRRPRFSAIPSPGAPNLRRPRLSNYPPAFGNRVAKQLPNSRHIIFPESSHGNWGFCGIKLMSDFIEKASTDTLDISCVTQQKPPKFKTNL